ncbi:MAG: hypothetical protein ACAI25_08065 [Planctomycetota bacterium]
MLSKKLWLTAMVAFSLVAPATAFAQDMGGGGEEKKDEPKAEPKADEPKPDEPKKEEPKPAEGAKKSLAFEKPESFKDDKGPRGMMKHLFQLESIEGEQEASVTVIFVGQGADYEKEKDRWVKAFEDKEGKKLGKSAIKEESFESNGVKGKTAEVAGNFAGRPRGKNKDEKAAGEKKWTKVVNVYLEGPDGAWILRLQGGEKTVDKNREDFMKYAKSVKIVDKTGEDPAPKKKSKKEG